MEATTVTFADLWPMMATLVGSLLAFVVVIMRLLHVSILGVSSRIDESAKESRELIERSSRENRELIEKVHAELSGGLTGVRGELADLRERLGEVRERLAYIEGYLKPPPSTSPDDDDAAAEAA